MDPTCYNTFCILNLYIQTRQNDKPYVEYSCVNIPLIADTHRFTENLFDTLKKI